MKNKGFTLIELAMVLFVAGLLLGGLLMPLSEQIESRKIANTANLLHSIENAITNFAIINGRLPCPSTETSSTIPGYGMENCSVNGGFLPFKAMQINNDRDEWDQRIRYFVDTNYVQNISLYNPSLDGDGNVIIDINGNVEYFKNNYNIVDPAGRSLTMNYPSPAGVIGEYPVIIIYSVGRNNIPDGENATADNIFQGGQSSVTFDDITVWLLRPELFNALVKKGALP